MQEALRQGRLARALKCAVPASLATDWALEQKHFEAGKR
jgi:hypothetical protein